MQSPNRDLSRQSPSTSPDFYAERSSIAFPFPSRARCILFISTAPFSGSLYRLSGAQAYINTPEQHKYVFLRTKAAQSKSLAVSQLISTMPAQIKKYKAAAVTAEPGWFDLELSVQKTIKWINEAGAAGCRLVAFPEVWIPGYPYWMWKINYQQSLPFLKAYRENSLPSDSDEMRRIRAAARENGIYVSLGYSEIDMATCHLAQVLIGPNGDVLNHRRKIKPTHVEKLVFGDGAGDSFEPVVDTDIGRVGQLNCWENMNPFLKAYACSLGEQVCTLASLCCTTGLSLMHTPRFMLLRGLSTPTKPV